MKQEVVAWLKIIGFVFTTTALIFLLFVLLGSNDGADGDYQNGYDAGYNAAIEDGTIAAASTQADIDSYLAGLTDEQWDNLRETYLGAAFQSAEESRENNMDMYVYGYSKGYRTAQKGQWDGETEEYLNGWDYNRLQAEASDLIGVS